MEKDEGFEFGKILLSVNKAAEHIGIGRNMLRKIISDSIDFPVVHVGAKKMIVMSEVKNWFLKNKKIEL